MKKVHELPGWGIEYPVKDWVQLTRQEDGKPIKIYTYRNPSRTPPRAVVVLLHGLNNYSLNTAHAARIFSQVGFEAVAMDHRGYGLSQGTRGNFKSVNTLVKDAAAFVKITQFKYPGIPIFIFGISLGGHIALRLSTMLDIAGVILLVPFVNVESKIVQNGIVKGLLAGASQILGQVGLRVQHVGRSSKYDSIEQWMLKDPYYYSGPINLRTLMALIKSCEFLNTHMDRITCPIIAFTAGNENAVWNDSLNTLLDTCASADTEVIHYPEAYHCITKEECIWDVYERMLTWIEQRVSASGARAKL